jgi:hypothetical protein
MDIETKFYKELTEKGVECRIIEADGKTETKFLPIRYMKLHIAILKNSYGEVVEEMPFIDSGYIKDEIKQRAYIARGIPPLVYKINEVMPIN